MSGQQEVRLYRNRGSKVFADIVTMPTGDAHALEVWFNDPLRVDERAYITPEGGEPQELNRRRYRAFSRREI